MKRQRGVSLSGLMVGVVILIVIALLGMKVAPSVLEYFQIIKAIKAVTQDISLKDRTLTEVRVAYSRQMQVGNFSKVEPTDLEITKDESGSLVISFAYSDKIPLFANVSLLIDYEGSSAK